MADFVDARSLEAGAQIPPAQVCIVGAGAAGISVARRLAARGVEVLLLEGGGLEPDPAAQQLCEGESVGIDYAGVAACRQRMFGGATNHWQGNCHPLRERDLAPVPGVPLARWPLGYAELAPFLREAEVELGFGPDDFEIGGFLPPREVELLAKSTQLAEARLIRQCEPTRLRFGMRYEAELRAAPKLRVLLHANVTRVALDSEGRRVRHLEVRSLDGRSFEAHAERYVLACNGIENARLLLASRDVIPAGVGNRSDWVGRCFMEHVVLPDLHGSAGALRPLSDVDLRLIDRNSTPREVNHCLTLPQQRSDAAACLQYMCFFRHSSPGREARGAWARLREGGPPFGGGALEDLRVLLSNLGGWFGDPDAGLYFNLVQAIEQAPNPDSRVLLSEQRDALGSPLPRLDWRIDEVDLRTFRTGQEAVARFLGANDLGRVQLPEISEAYLAGRVHGWCHHMGTTRMSGSAATGVVDRNSRVHETENLYVAGGSVFSRSVYSPTLALVAFSLRLAEHLASLARGGAR